MSPTPTPRTTQVIALARIDDPELDARVDRDDARVEELGRDIARRGQLLPIHVFVKGDRFEVVDGQTRLIAMRRQNLEEVEAFVYPSKDLALEGVKYAANIFRLDMSPADEAKMFFELFTHECGEDIERLAALTGKNISYVDKRLRLVSGDDQIFDAVKRKAITLAVAEALNKIDKPDYRRYYLQLAERDGITATVAERWLAEYRSLHADRPSSPAPEATAAAPAVVASSYDPSICYVCRESTAELPELISVHPSCKQAVLRKLIDAYHGGPSPS